MAYKTYEHSISICWNSTDDIEVTVGFWAKTTDTDPVSENANGDMRLIVRNTYQLAVMEIDQRVLFLKMTGHI